jgi:hypothetical protein
MSRGAKAETSGSRVNLRLETQPSGTIAASVIEFPDCYVEAATRKEAVGRSCNYGFKVNTKSEEPKTQKSIHMHR